MSSLDNNKPFNTSLSEKQFNGFFVPNHNAKIIRDAIENGTAPFLPDNTGKINAEPIINGNTGFCLNAKDLLPLQIIKGENSNMVATFKTVQNAGTRVIEGEKGFFYNFQREDKSVGTAQFFFPEQTQEPEVVKAAILEKMNKAYAKGFPKLNKTLEITSAEPEEYLANYVAACKTGAKLSVNPEVAEEFKQNLAPLLKNQTARLENKNQEMETLGQFMFKVDQKANEISKELFEEVKRENKKQFAQTKKKEQEQEIVF